MDYSKIYKRIADSIVNVIQYDKRNNLISTASGVIIDDGSKVLTCSHCINLDININNGILSDDKNRAIPGKIIFNDINNDIAILEIQNFNGVPLRIVNSDSAEIGNEVFTIGYPYNVFSEKTLTCGNIAAFENGLIKIDTSVNNGNSGGPLFNINGDIIGIINTKLGRLSKFLEEIERAKPQASIIIGKIDPIKAFQQMLREMQLNLNIGIGYAIPTKRIGEISILVKSIMIKQ